METQKVDKRLNDAIKRRDGLEAEAQRIIGKLEAAKQSLGEVQEACRKKGIEPDQLEGTIEMLKGRYEDAVTEIELKVEQTEEALSPFKGETDED
jgi:hypothetical protein